jgi:TonB family protein
MFALPLAPTKLEVCGYHTMQRWILVAFLAFSMAGVVLCDRFSVAQQDQPDARRKVLSRVAPTYPDLARRTNVHGVVKLLVVVAADGKVTSTEVVGGNPVLAQAAVEAVRKWRYEAAPQQTYTPVELRFDAH